MFGFGGVVGFACVWVGGVLWLDLRFFWGGVVVVIG